MTVYGGSDGAFYTDWEVGWNLESGDWQVCMWDEDAGWELFETQSEELVWLLPMDESELPEWAEVERLDRGSRVVDRREQPGGLDPLE